MSKRVEYPNGFIGVAPDKVAEALAKRPGYKIVGDAPATKPKDKDEEKLITLQKQLKDEQGKSNPNQNTIRALENQIAKLEG